MADLKALNEKVTAAISARDGSRTAEKAMLDSIEELRIAAMGPARYTIGLRYQALQNTCLMIASEMRLLDHIVANKDRRVTATDLAEATKSDKTLVVRIMRMLTALRICDEVDKELYFSNANAEYLNSPSSQGALRFINGPTLKVMASTIPYMKANGGKFIQFPDAATGETSIVNFAHGMSLWELFRAEPDILADFTAYLNGRREGMVGYWFDIYPARSKVLPHCGTLRPDEVLIVDVGGNVGYDLQAFRQRFPDSDWEGRLVLQDLAENITKARKVLAGTGIECMEHDFFTPQPVKKAKFYYFGGIFHDWPDAQSKQILANTAAAMDKESRIIIDEMPLPDRNAPLDLVSYDILMMLNVNGIERTIGHWKQILDDCGLELMKTYPSKLDTVLEVMLK